MTADKPVILDILPIFSPSHHELEAALTAIGNAVRRNLGISKPEFLRIPVGQNMNYRIVDSKKANDVIGLLKIITKRGYPSISALKLCYKLLEEHGVQAPRLLYSDHSSTTVPYGYFIQSWITGEDAQERYNFTRTNAAQSTEVKWVQDFTSVLPKVHNIRVPAWGALADGPRYSSALEYYANLEEVVDKSFGGMLREGQSIRSIEEQNMLSYGTIDAVVSRAGELATKVRWPSQPVLIHGDMFPPNLIYTAPNGVALIDWDESRGGCWIQEIARTLFFYPSERLTKAFLDTYPHLQAPLDSDEIDIAIRLEHARQTLRYMMMSCFGVPSTSELTDKITILSRRLIALLRL